MLLDIEKVTREENSAAEEVRGNSKVLCLRKDISSVHPFNFLRLCSPLRQTLQFLPRPKSATPMDFLPVRMSTKASKGRPLMAALTTATVKI